MPHLSVDGATVEALLDKAGFPVERIAPDTYRTRFRGRVRTHPILLRVDPEGYIHFAVVPYLESPADLERSAALYHRLLELNQSLLFAKFSIDDDLDVVLSVEYPTQELDESEFVDALDTLTYYAEKLHDELSELVRGPV